jgi:phosphohistidine phosphatase SixA
MSHYVRTQNCAEQLLASSFRSAAHPSIYPSVHIEQLLSYWMDLHEILYLRIFRNLC